MSSLFDKISTHSLYAQDTVQCSGHENKPKQLLHEDTNVETMSSILSSVCLTGELADVYFKFPDDSGTRIPAHKTLLSLRSPVFKAMFNGTFPKTEDDIFIDDVTAPVFKTFIRYLYTDQVSFNKDNVILLMYTGKKYQVKPLLSQCGSYLSKNLNTTNACTIYCHARFFEVEYLVKRSLNFIKTKTSEVFRDDDFLSISSEDLSEILKLENLNIAEIDIFKSLLRWADRKLSEANQAISDKSRRKVLVKGNILYSVALPNLSIDDYTQVVLPTGILSDEEELQVFKAITMVGPNKPATKFNTNRRLQDGITTLTVDEILTRSHGFSGWTCDLSESVIMHPMKETILKSVTIYPRFQRRKDEHNKVWHLHWNMSSNLCFSPRNNCFDFEWKDKQVVLNINTTLAEKCETSLNFTMTQTPRSYEGTKAKYCPLNKLTLKQQVISADNVCIQQIPSSKRMGRQLSSEKYSIELPGQNELSFCFTGAHLIHGFQFKCEKRA